MNDNNNDEMIFIWVDYRDGGGFEPHITFQEGDMDDALFELQDLRDHGYRAKIGGRFPDRRVAV